MSNTIPVEIINGGWTVTQEAPAVEPISMAGWLFWIGLMLLGIGYMGWRWMKHETRAGYHF